MAAIKKTLHLVFVIDTGGFVLVYAIVLVLVLTWSFPRDVNNCGKSKYTNVNNNSNNNNNNNNNIMGDLINPVAALILLNLTGFVVIVLNGFSLFVFLSRRKHKRISNIPLLWILVANILIGMFPLPIYGLKKYNFEDPNVSGRVCDAWRYTYFACIHLALCSLLIMTFQKIFILSFPLRYKQMLNGFRTNLAYVIAWIFLILFDLIPFIPFNEKDKENCHYKIKEKWAVTMNIITMAIPLPVIICCYGYMLHLAYVQTVRIRKETYSVNKDSKKGGKQKIRMWIEVKATRRVALIIGAYIFLWTPSTLYYLLVWLCPDCFPENYQPHKTWIRFFFKLMVMLHALVTPIIFCCQNREFRKDARKSLAHFSNGFHNSGGTHSDDSG